jgi:hypothetical protein
VTATEEQEPTYPGDLDALALAERDPQPELTQPRVEWTDSRFGTMDSAGEWTPAAPEGLARNSHEAALSMGTDGDDFGRRVKVKIRIDGNGDHERTMRELAPIDLMQSGHGFMIDNQRSRPWKTAPRTHCAHCGGPLPDPDVSKYRCEIDPHASEIELSLVGEIGQGPDDRAGYPFDNRKPRYFKGCQCGGCTLRNFVTKGWERGQGQPRKYCSDPCRKQFDNARNAWKRAVVRAEKRGEEPPPPPEDKGLKFRPVRGLRSGAEGTGHRYVASKGLPWGAPRA